MKKQYISAFTKAPVLVAALFITLVLPLVSMPEIIHADMNNTRADTWGTLEYSGSSWMGGSGVDVYSNGSTVQGPSPDTYNCFSMSGGGGGLGCSTGTVPTGIKWQCVELVNRFAMSHGWITSRWAGNGNTLKDSIPTGFNKEDNDHISYLNPGDIITFDQAGTTGHAAVINTVSPNIQVANQNTVAVFSNTSITSGSLAAGNAHLSSYLSGYTVQAVIHRPSGTVTGSRPAVITRGSDHMDVFYKTNDADPKLTNVGWNATNGWGIPGYVANAGVASNPTAVARGTDSMDIFYRDSDNNLKNIGWTAANGWATPTSRVATSTVQGDPVVISLDSAHMDVFYRDSSNRLMDERWNATTGWDVTPLVIISSSSVAGNPTATTLDSTHFHVLYRDTSNSMQDVWYSAGSWGGPLTIINAATAGDYTAIARSSTHLDVFYPASNGGLGNTYWDNCCGWNYQTWTGSSFSPNSSAYLVGRPYVISRDPNSMSVYYADNFQGLIEKSWGSTSGWASPLKHSDDVYDNPAGVSRDSGSMDMFYRNAQNNLTNAGWGVTTGWHVSTISGAGGMN